MNSFFSRGALAVSAVVCLWAAGCVDSDTDQEAQIAPCNNQSQQGVTGDGGAGGSGGGSGEGGGQAVVDPVACETIWDCPRDCTFYGCVNGKCSPMVAKPDGSSCDLTNPSTVAYCVAGACAPGCDYVTDCEFKDCSDITCANHACSYQPNPSNCLPK